MGRIKPKHKTDLSPSDLVILNKSQPKRLIQMKHDHRKYDPSHGMTNLAYNTNSDHTLIFNNFIYNISKHKGEKHP